LIRVARKSPLGKVLQQAPMHFGAFKALAMQHPIQVQPDGSIVQSVDSRMLHTASKPQQHPVSGYR
jgi:hypothetical protein